MNVVASVPEGLEKYLAEEILNLGGFKINTYKIKKILFNTSICSNIYTLVNYLLQLLSYLKKVESFQTPRIIWLIRLI